MYIGSGSPCKNYQLTFMYNKHKTLMFVCINYEVILTIFGKYYSNIYMGKVLRILFKCHIFGLRKSFFKGKRNFFLKRSYVCVEQKIKPKIQYIHNPSN